MLNSSVFELLHLQAQSLRKKGVTITQLFDDELQRFNHYSCSATGIFLDYSKNYINHQTLQLLFHLVDQQQVLRLRDAMFAGEKVNFTENLPALHTALRAPKKQPHWIDGVDINQQIHQVLMKISHFVQAIHSGQWLGATGLPIQDVVNLGTGGSELGARMACQALSHFSISSLRFHFVVNVHECALKDILNKINPATTLFIIASKSFQTHDTLLNAQSVKKWFLQYFSEVDMSRHFVAISAHAERAQKWGIVADNHFDIWQWVGGRFSLCSAMGLPVALMIGFEQFQALLSGAHAMDQHFKEAPLNQNMPILLALIALWNTSILNYPCLSIVPYHHHLSVFPAYIQQLEMESLGKNVDINNQNVDFVTGAVIWGAEGTNAQHTYFQHLHQSAMISPVDFIAVLTGEEGWEAHQKSVLSNCFAQSRALMLGKNVEQVRKELKQQGLSDQKINSLSTHYVFNGNRPSNTILLEKLNATTLGALIALYEHKVVVQGFCLKINSFDQFGVQLGKNISEDIAQDLKEHNRDLSHYDDSTVGLITKAKQYFDMTS